MLFEALTGKPPLNGSGLELLIKKQSENAPKLSVQHDIPKDLGERVDRLLHREPKHRATANDISPQISRSKTLG